MRRSTTVLLVLSGSLLGGCDQRAPSFQSAQTGSSIPTDSDLMTTDTIGGIVDTNAPALTNNTYVANRGYYHAPYHSWYPFPYNYYVPGAGYYHGGRYNPAPHNSPVSSSQPYVSRSSTPRTTLSSSRSSSSSSRSSSIIRGGFSRSSGGSHFNSGS
jgi:hypothetical protein